MLKRRGGYVSIRGRSGIDKKIGSILSRMVLNTPAITFGDTVPDRATVGDEHFYDGDTTDDFRANTWYKRSSSETWIELGPGDTADLTDYLFLEKGILNKILAFAKGQVLPAELLEGDIPDTVRIRKYVEVGGDTMTGNLYMSDKNIKEVGRLSGIDSDVYVDLSVDGYITITADTEIELDAPTVRIGDTLILENGTSVDEFSIDGTMAGNSDDAVPTEKAVKTYADTIPAIEDTVCDSSGVIVHSGSVVYAQTTF